MAGTIDELAPAEPAGEEPGLVARARGGDARAFEQLYRRHADKVYGLCWRLCDGDRAKAEQATQDAFVRAWEKLDTFRGEAQFGTWIHRITVNVVLGDRRLLQRWTTFEDAEAGGPRPELSAPAADHDLSRALSRLPRGARTVLWLHDVEGYLHEVERLPRRRSPERDLWPGIQSRLRPRRSAVCGYPLMQFALAASLVAGLAAAMTLGLRDAGPGPAGAGAASTLALTDDSLRSRWAPCCSRRRPGAPTSARSARMSP